MTQFASSINFPQITCWSYDGYHSKSWMAMISALHKLFVVNVRGIYWVCRFLWFINRISCGDFYILCVFLYVCTQEQHATETTKNQRTVFFFCSYSTQNLTHHRKYNSMVHIFDPVSDSYDRFFFFFFFSVLCFEFINIQCTQTPIDFIEINQNHFVKVFRISNTWRLEKDGEWMNAFQACNFCFISGFFLLLNLIISHLKCNLFLIWNNNSNNFMAQVHGTVKNTRFWHLCHGDDMTYSVIYHASIVSCNNNFK